MSISTLAKSGAHSVDKLLGNAFLIVKEVQENLDAIRAAAFLINPDAFLKRTLAVPIGETAPTIDARNTLKDKILGVSPDGLRIIGIDPSTLGGGGTGGGGDGTGGGTGTIGSGDVTHGDGTLDEVILEIINLINIERDRLNAQIDEMVLLADEVVANATSTAGIDSRLTQLALDFDEFDGVVAQINALNDGLAGVNTLIVNETAARVDGDTAIAATIGLIGAKSGDNNAFILDIDTVKVSATESFAERFTAIKAEQDGAIALIQDEQTARTSAIEAEVVSRTQMGAQIRTDLGGELSAAILTEQTARVEGDLAEATAREVLAVTLRQEMADGGSGDFTAAIETERQARIDGDSAEATARTTLAAALRTETDTKIGAAVSDEASARVDADSAEAQARESLGATLQGNINGVRTDVTALVVAEESARVSGDEAEAAARTLTAAQIRSDLRGELSAGILSEENARVAGDLAEANARTALAAALRNERGIEISAAVLTETNARIAGDEAEASQRTQLAARVGDAESNITRIDSVIVGEAAEATTQAKIAAAYANTKGNLLPNGDFEAGSALWNATRLTHVASHPTYGGVWQYNSDVHGGGYVGGDMLGPLISIDPTRRYRAVTHWVQHTGTCTNYAGLQCFDASGNNLGNIYFDTLIGQTFAGGEGYIREQIYQGINAGLPNPTYTGGGMFPPNTVKVRPILLVNYNSAAGVLIDWREFELFDVTESAAAAAQADLANTQRVLADQHRAAALSSEGLAATYRDQALGHKQTAESKAQISIDKAAEATSSAASASSSAVLSASLSIAALNRNAQFTDYSSAAQDALPATWSYWSTGNGAKRGTSPNGGYSLEMDCQSVNRGAFGVVQLPSNAGVEVKPGDWIVMESDVELVSGTLSGIGHLIRWADSNGQISGNEIDLNLSAMPDITGAVPFNNGAGKLGQDGRVYRWRKLIQVPSSYNPPTGKIYVYNYFMVDQYFFAYNPKKVKVYRCAIRLATPQEVRDQTVLTPLQASVSETSSVAISASNKADAAQGTANTANNAANAAQGTANSANSLAGTANTAAGNAQTAANTAQSGVNQVLAKYGVRLDVNGYITGFEQNNNGSVGNFTINADNFSIVKPGGGARTEYSNGNWRVYDDNGTMRTRMGVWP